MLIKLDDDRMTLRPGEKVEERLVRFRTLGCYPLTGAIESSATNLSDIVEEMLIARTSERQGRAIDRDEAGSMERRSVRAISNERRIEALCNKCSRQ